MVKADINSYAKWPLTNSKIYVDGIFFDEATSNDDQASLTYYQTLVAYGKNKAGIGMAGKRFIVTNPGQIPKTDAYLKTFPAPDLVVVFEETYAKWMNSVDSNRQAIWGLDADNSQLAIMLHDVPVNLSCSKITELAQDLKGNVGVGSIWFTDLKGDNSYLGWPKSPNFGKYINSFELNGKAC